MAAMGLAARHLVEDEEVVLDFHPHWKTLVGPAALVLVTVAVAGLLIAFVPAGGYRPAVRSVIAGLALVAVFAWFVVPLLRWRTTSYVLTTRRLVLREGILSRRGRDIPLTRVNDVSFSHTLLERLLGCGTLVVESAGERGRLVLREIPRVEYVHSELYRRVEDEQERLSRDEDQERR